MIRINVPAESSTSPNLRASSDVYEDNAVEYIDA